MALFFLALIYLAFISLGLPDALLGAVWPVMRLEFGAPLDGAGMIFVIISGGTIISSLCSGWVTGRFGTGKVTVISVFLTAAALIGSSAGRSVWFLMLMAIPLGLGAGSVDASLNGYVALHYKSRHISWLHCFWGVGAFAGPVIIGACLRQGNNWRAAYFTVGLIQAAVAALLFITLPLWRKAGGEAASPEHTGAGNGASGSNPPDQALEGKSAGKNLFRIPGVPQALITFFLYCSCEYTVGLWGASFLSEIREFSKPAAASAVSLYYAGITLGRFFSGFLTMRFTGQQLIRGGLCVIFAGALLFLLPLPPAFSLPSLLLIGLGCSPIYPSMIQLTPERFGKENSQKIIGLQMASAYTGITLVPPLVGVLAARTAMIVIPAAVLGYAALMMFLSEQINRKALTRK